MKETYSGTTIPTSGVELIVESATTCRVRYDIQPAPTPHFTDDPDADTQDQLVCECVRIPNPPTYDSIVSAIVTSRYTIDAQIAMLANQGDKDAQHQAEYKEFESFRARAKAIAHTLLD